MATQVTLSGETLKSIKDFVTIYCNASGDVIPEDMVELIIERLVAKYVAIKQFPSDWEDTAIQEDVENYFSSNATEVAYKVPEIYGRIGAEGETTHTENGITRVFTYGDPFRDAFPQVIPYAKTI